jgi:hypothetical protein
VLKMSSQLAVSHGLVIDRIQALKYSGTVIRERCCRISYGVVVREKYDPLIHIGEEVSIDPRDKNKWAERQIHWLIKQVTNAFSFTSTQANEARVKEYLSTTAFTNGTESSSTSAPNEYHGGHNWSRLHYHPITCPGACGA